jgi:hypothetical protein
MSMKYEDDVPTRHDPAIPQSHPIITKKLEEWKHAALKKAIHDDYTTNQIKAFAHDLRYVSFACFKSALEHCFVCLKKTFHPSEYGYALLNKNDYSSLNKGNSEAWMADIVAYEKWIVEAIPSKKTINVDARRDKKVKQVLNVFVEDACYLASSLGTTFQEGCGDGEFEYFPHVYIVPYVANMEYIDMLIQMRRDFVYMNAASGVITKCVHTRDRSVSRRQGDYRVIKTFEPISLSEVDFAKTSIVLYYEEMLGIPFYFDHKLADSKSWPHALWMFKGFHSSDDEFCTTMPLARTNFIAGCESPPPDNPRDKNQPYECPAPPYKFKVSK